VIERLSHPLRATPDILFLIADHAAQALRIKALEDGVQCAIADLRQFAAGPRSDYEGTEEELVGDYIALLGSTEGRDDG
jgi:hypothetical protein